MSDFVEDFISSCVDSGITKPADMCKKAIERRNEIDSELEKIYELREERDKLQKVLKAFNHEDVKRSRRIKPTIVNNELKEAEDDPSYKELLKEIVDVVESSSKPLTSRELIDKVGYDGLDPSPVYLAIKWLFERSVLMRDEEKKSPTFRAILKGSAWDNRNTYFSINI